MYCCREGLHHGNWQAIVSIKSILREHIVGRPTYLYADDPVSHGSDLSRNAALAHFGGCLEFF